MNKIASLLMALSMSLGSMAFAENQTPDRDFAPDANPNVNPPLVAVQDPGGQRPPTPTFEQWVEGGKKIPQGLVFTGGSPFFNESTGKNRSDEDAYKIIFGVPGSPRPETGDPEPRPEVERPDPRVEEYRKLEKALAGNKEWSAKAERDLQVKIAEANKNPDKREVEIHVKNLVAEHEAAMKGHERENEHIESRLAELKEIPEVVICIFPPKPERKPFPPHWGRPPAAQTRDLRPLPGNFGPELGSSTLCAWVERNIKADLANKDKPKPEPKRPPVVRPPAPPRPDISQETKADLAEIEKDKADLFKAMKVELGKLAEGSSKEDVRKAVEQFKKDNADKFAEIKAASDKVHEELKAKRPERKKRPEPPAEVKAKIADVKKAEKQIHQARRSVSNDLKKAQDELAAKIAEAKKNPDKREVAIEIKNLVAEQAAARKAALDAFKESQKEKHKELKSAQKELRETIRATKETGSSRTSR